MGLEAVLPVAVTVMPETGLPVAVAVVVAARMSGRLQVVAVCLGKALTVVLECQAAQAAAAVGRVLLVRMLRPTSAAMAAREAPL